MYNDNVLRKSYVAVYNQAECETNCRRDSCISRTVLLKFWVKKWQVWLIQETIDLRALSYVSGVQTSSPNDWVVTKQKFCIVLLHYLVQILLFFAAVGFSNEDNRCQLQRIIREID